jgi:CDGSH-type Zn-finger protein
VTPEGAPADQIETIVRQCPSGALGFIKDGVRYEGEQREAEIVVSHNQSYWIRGGIELEGEPRNQSASLEHYALCRCGHSKNKPFCDGSHYDAKFNDPDN